MFTWNFISDFLSNVQIPKSPKSWSEGKYRVLARIWWFCCFGVVVVVVVVTANAYAVDDVTESDGVAAVVVVDVVSVYGVMYYPIVNPD